MLSLRLNYGHSDWPLVEKEDPFLMQEEASIKKLCLSCYSLMDESANSCAKCGDQSLLRVSGETIQYGTALVVGQLFEGKFEILEKIGEGGMGTVFKAKQIDQDRVVAVKQMNAIHLSDSESVKRFLREGKYLCRLENKNIVKFYFFGFTENNIPYGVIEYIEGKSLDRILAQDRHVPPNRAIRIMKQVGDALKCAHTHGILHRDLKPANIMVCDSPEKDFVKVLDFGLAKVTEVSGIDTTKLTKTGFLVGSPHYMSPEQSRGFPADERSDVYACGCVLFEMITGQKPFDSDNPIGLLYKHCNEIPLSFAETKFGNDCMPQFEWVCRKALEKEPGARYQKMEEFIHDLECLASGQGKLLALPIDHAAVKPKETYLPPRSTEVAGSKKTSKMIPLVVLSILIGILLGAAGVWWFMTKVQHLSPVDAISIIQDMTHPQGVDPEVLRARQSGPMVKGWVLYQDNPHTGQWQVYLSSQGMASVNNKMGCTLVTSAPDWNVVMYNDKTRVYFLSPMSEWKGATLKTSSHGGKASAEKAAAYKSMLIEKEPKEIGAGIVLGHPAKRFLTDNLASTGLKKVEFWECADIQPPAELKQVFSKIYGVGLSRMSGLPLKVSYIDENGKRTPVFMTTKVEFKEFPQGLLRYPSSYKKVDSEIAVLMDEKGQKAMKAIMDETKTKESNELDELLNSTKSPGAR